MKVVICGGGISGLTAAYYASKFLSKSSSQAFKIILLEKTKNVGGWMQTNVANGDRKVYDGAINEHGPRSIRVAGIAGNNTLQLISDLGLEESVLPVKSSDVAAKKRLIYVNGQLHELPNSLMSMLRKRKPFSQSLAKCVVPGLMKKVPSNYETMHEICCSRFGNEFADYLVSSFTRGVFAADSRHLSMKAAFPILWEKLKPRAATLPRKPTLNNARLLNKAFLANPFIRKAKHEKWTQWGISQGFQYLTEELARHLVEEKNVQIIREAEVERITLNTDEKITVTMSYPDSTSCKRHKIDNVDHLISALPSHSFSKILRKQNVEPNHKGHLMNVLGLTLSHISWVDVAVTNLEYNRPPKELLPTVAFGHLVPSVEPSNVLGVVYDSCGFPQHDRLGTPSTRLTCMSGGSWFSQLFGDPDSVQTTTIEEAALKSLAEQLSLTEDPLSINTTICKKCIPTYKIGHTKLVEEAEDLIDEHHLPISLVGSSYWGVSVNDCVLNSRIAVVDMLRKHKLSE